jgi:hypothetical protein
LNRSAGFLTLSALVLLAGGALLLTRETPPKSPRKEQTPLVAAAPASSLPAPPPPPPPRASVAPVVSSAAAPLPGEAAFMVELRELLRASPGRALELSRSGEQRFGDSADAAERSWVTVKALSELGRHAEARAEGKKLVERYRGTRWAEDVYRHLFVNPPTHPAERGYGKTLENE